MSEDLKKLIKIAEALRDRDLAQLAVQQAQREKAMAARKEFARQAEQEDKATVDSLGYRRDHEIPRRVWRDRRLYALNHYEARAAAQVETYKRIASTSFGRADVLNRILSQRTKKP